MLVIPLSPIFQLFFAVFTKIHNLSDEKKKQRKNKLPHKSVGLSLLQMGVRSRAQSGRWEGQQRRRRRRRRMRMGARSECWTANLKFLCLDHIYKNHDKLSHFEDVLSQMLCNSINQFGKCQDWILEWNIKSYILYSKNMSQH